MIPCLPHPIHSVQQSELDEAVCSPRFPLPYNLQPVQGCCFFTGSVLSVCDTWYGVIL